MTKKLVSVVSVFIILAMVGISECQYHDESIGYNPGRCDRMGHPYKHGWAKNKWEGSDKNRVVGHQLSTYVSLQDVIYCMKELFNEIQENERQLYFMREELREVLEVLRKMQERQ